MPNWCYNSTTITHRDEEKIREVISAIKAGTLFNYFRPMPAELESTKAHEGNNWWDWRVDNWGTKHDIGENIISFDEDSAYFDGQYWQIIIGYDTAWAPPLECLQFAEQYGFLFTTYYNEPGIGFCGMYTTGGIDYSIDYEDISADNPVLKELDDELNITGQLDSKEYFYSVIEQNESNNSDLPEAPEALIPIA